jgi:hypothetical protein
VPNSANIKRPIIFLGLGRSGTSAITEILSHHPQIDNIGEVSPVIWDVYDGVRLANMNMRYPTPVSGTISRSELAARAVRGFFQENYHSEKVAWVIKPIGPIGHVREAFEARSSDALFLDWYFGALEDCFPEASIFCLVRDPIQYTRSARRYWGASFGHVSDDLKFMSTILRSGRVAADRFIPMKVLRDSPKETVARILKESGLEPYDFPEKLFSVQYAAEQGKAIAGTAKESPVEPFAPAQERRFFETIGDEYRPFMAQDWALSDFPGDVEEEAVDVDYRSAYRALIDEFNFLKTKAAGLENLVHEKEDIVANLLAWTKTLEGKAKDRDNLVKEREDVIANLLTWVKILETKAERFADAMREANVPFPVISEPETKE